MTTRWDDAMRAALAEAAAAAERGDVPVGAVLLDADGNIVARAANERALGPLAHAEMLALWRSETHRLDGCTLVVTLEPCTMCAGALAQARVERLVFGAFDPKAGAVSSVFDVLRDPRLPHRVDVVTGVMADESEALLRDFFSTRR